MRVNGEQFLRQGGDEMKMRREELDRLNETLEAVRYSLTRCRMRKKVDKESMYRLNE